MIWPNEASEFTPWHCEEDNLALLADTIGIEIELVEREARVERNKMIGVIADKAYGFRSMRAMLVKRKAKSCIPSKCNAKIAYSYDKELYKSAIELKIYLQKLKIGKALHS